MGKNMTGQVFIGPSNKCRTLEKSHTAVSPSGRSSVHEYFQTWQNGRQGSRQGEEEGPQAGLGRERLEDAAGLCGC